MKRNISDQRHSMSFCLSQLPLCLSIEFYTFYLTGLAYFFSSLLLDILLFYCDCSFAFFFPLYCIYFMSQDQSVRNKKSCQVFYFERVPDGNQLQTYWKCRGAREKGFYLEIGKLLTQEPGAQSTPCLLYWRSYHCPCWTPSEGLRTGVPGVLSCLSRPPATPASCECLTLTKLLGMRLLREAGKCLLAPKVHNRVEKGSVELRDKGFLKRWGNTGNSGSLYFGGLQNHCRW